MKLHGRKQVFAILVFSLGLLCQTWAQASTLVCGSASRQPAITLMMGDRPAVNASVKSLLGVNTLYFIEDDRVWKEGLPAKLRPLKLSSLRFPGGEVADRYDWETGGKDNPGGSEKENRLEVAGYTDYLEFLERAKTAGINDIYFVVNLESAFLALGDRSDNVRRYAEKASRWVAEVKRRGYSVKYWEIGNESYLNGSAFSLTSEEYADALSVFSRAMKQSDPNIVVAVNGPSGVNTVGYADKFTTEQLAFFRDKGKKICGWKPDKDCIGKIRQTIPGVAYPRPWWDVLVERAGKDFDMAVIHSYSTVRLPKSSDGTGFKEMKQVQQLRERLERGTGRKIAISVTEWNVPPKRREIVSRNQAALLNAIKLGNYMAAGVEHAHFWPLRYPGTESGDRALLTMEGLKITPMYRTFEAVTPVMNAAFVDQAVLDNGVYALKTVSGVAEQVMLVNVGTQARKVELRMTDGLPRAVRVNQLSGEDMNGGELCQGGDVRSSVVILLPPGSLTTANLVPR